MKNTFQFLLQLMSSRFSDSVIIYFAYQDSTSNADIGKALLSNECTLSLAFVNSNVDVSWGVLAKVFMRNVVRWDVLTSFLCKYCLFQKRKYDQMAEYNIRGGTHRQCRRAPYIIIIVKFYDFSLRFSVKNMIIENMNIVHTICIHSNVFIIIIWWWLYFAKNNISCGINRYSFTSYIG